MGGVDKLMIDVNGVPLLRRQIDRAAGIGPIYVALPHGDHPRVAALTGTDASPLIVPEATQGMGATTDGRAGHPIIFDASLRPAFAKLSGDSGGESLINPLHDQTYLERFVDDRARYDLDTPADWHAWRVAQASPSNN